MTPLSERLAQLRNRLGTLREFARRDPAAVPHVRVVQEKGFAYEEPFDPYSLNPSVPIEALESVERELGTRLPESFRQFLLELGDGGHAGPFPEWNLASVAASGLHESHIEDRLGPAVIPAGGTPPALDDLLDEEQASSVKARSRMLLMPCYDLSEYGLIVDGPLGGQLYLLNSTEPVCGSGADIIDLFSHWVDRKQQSLREREQRRRERREPAPTDASALCEAAFRLYSESDNFEGGPSAARQQAESYLRQMLALKAMPLDVLARNCERLWSHWAHAMLVEVGQAALEQSRCEPTTRAQRCTVHRYMGLAFVRLGQPAAAVPHFENALRLLNEQQRFPADARELIQAGLGEAHLALNQPEGAIAALDPQPHGFWPLRVLGDAYRMAGKPQQARDTYQRSIQCYGGDPHSHLGLAELDLSEGNFSAAEQRCRRAMKCMERPLRTYLCLARIFVRQGRLLELSHMLGKLRKSRLDLELMRKDPELAPHFIEALR
ncbi:hypothetical protein [Pyxidicoccus trucidator]|uniref:hypothetical protein n=1 Tax=Pyxidicoccus trucidator TaxID=2709662 RepID=UPI0013DA3B34|nr:hypothetical protein [Pyxidicoccus trucidator]